MQRLNSTPGPVADSVEQYSGAAMCLTVAVFHALQAQHHSISLFWLVMSIGLGYRTALPLRRPVQLLLLGAWLALAATLGWQAVQSASRVHVPHATPFLSGAPAEARAVQAGLSLTRCFAAFL